MDEPVKAYLTKRSRNRPGDWIGPVRLLVLHMPRVAMQRAMAVRDYWESGVSTGSAHEVIDLDGTSILTVPTDEVAYHSGAYSYTRLKEFYISKDAHPWEYAIGLETCHVDMDGTLTDETWNALIRRCIWHCDQRALNPRWAIVTHEMMTGHLDKWGEGYCHQLFHDHPDKLEELRYEVAKG